MKKGSKVELCVPCRGTLEWIPGTVLRVYEGKEPSYDVLLGGGYLHRKVPFYALRMVVAGPDDEPPKEAA